MLLESNKYQTQEDENWTNYKDKQNKIIDRIDKAFSYSTTKDFLFPIII